MASLERTFNLKRDQLETIVAYYSDRFGRQTKASAVRLLIGEKYEEITKKNQ